jgi:hypothetical protein
MFKILFTWIAYVYTYGIYLFLGFMFVFIIGFHIYESITERKERS